jgi:FixJ family two-component response regulator
MPFMFPKVNDESEPTVNDMVVYVVDDDPGALQSLSGLLRQGGFSVRQFDNSADFLSDLATAPPGCLVLDLAMPEIDGLTVLERLVTNGVQMPTIIVTGVGDVPSCVRAFKMGVLDFLEKPIDPEDLLASVRKGVAQAVASLTAHRRAKSAVPRADLTAREKQVLDLILTGKTLKQIASQYQVTVQSVWKHQRRIFDKFGVQNTVELVQLLLSAQRRP